MDLIIGGAFQGKLAYVKKSRNVNTQDIADCVTCGEDKLLTAKVIWHFEELIRKYGSKSIIMINNILANNPCVVVICREVGSGIVSINKDECIYRENVGRTLCVLAEKSSRMERIIAGIPMIIK